MSDIEVPVWVRDGGMIVRRDALGIDHPESTYNYIKNVLGKTPEEYGYFSCELTEEQRKLLESIPNEAIWAEAERRERAVAAEEMYGNC